VRGAVGQGESRKLFPQGGKKDLYPAFRIQVLSVTIKPVSKAKHVVDLIPFGFGDYSPVMINLV
jgi:hypothetical protein